METTSEESGLEALQRLRATDPPVWLAPSPSLSQIARTASEHLFALLRPFTPKTPFDKLLTQGFDAEQIWQQIDLQAHPLMSTILRREVNQFFYQFEKNPGEISKLMKVLEVEKKESKSGRSVVKEESEDFDEEFDGFDEELDEEGEGEEEDEEGGGDGIEDGFLKIKELEEFLEEDEVREYGLKKKDKKEEKKVDGLGMDEDEDEDDEDEDEDDDEDEDGDELGDFGHGDDEDADKLATC